MDRVGCGVWGVGCADKRHTIGPIIAACTIRPTGFNSQSGRVPCIFSSETYTWKKGEKALIRICNLVGHII